MIKTANTKPYLKKHIATNHYLFISKKINTLIEEYKKETHTSRVDQNKLLVSIT